MSQDEKTQRALQSGDAERILIEARRAGMPLVVMPPPAVLKWLKREANWFRGIDDNLVSGELLEWLRSFGEAPLCQATGGPDCSRCDLDAGHESKQHSRTTKKRGTVEWDDEPEYMPHGGGFQPGMPVTFMPMLSSAAQVAFPPTDPHVFPGTIS